jgi:plastocyanin
MASALMGFAAATSSLAVAASESLLMSATKSAKMGMSTGSSSAAGAMAPGAMAAAGMVNTHIIQVGGPNGSLAFFPNNVKAAAGDLVQFQFHPKV